MKTQPIKAVTIEHGKMLKELVDFEIVKTAKNDGQITRFLVNHISHLNKILDGLWFDYGERHVSSYSKDKRIDFYNDVINSCKHLINMEELEEDE